MLDCWSLVASGGENFDKRCRDFLRRKNRGISEILGGGRLKSPDSFSLIRAAASYGWLRSFADAQATSSMTVALGERRRGQVPLLYIQRSPARMPGLYLADKWEFKIPKPYVCIVSESVLSLV